MSESEATHELRRWLRYAQEDLELASLLEQNPDASPRHACFNAQQSAEKAIKSIFVFSQIEFPYVHDLRLLLTLVPDDWQLKRNPPNLARLSNWAVNARYPDSPKEATIDDAAMAVQTARTVFGMVAADLRQRGFVFDD